MTALLLNSATRSALRSDAHSLNPTVMIGADGLTPAVVKEANAALNSHNLIKIRVLGDDREARIAIYEDGDDVVFDIQWDRAAGKPIEHVEQEAVVAVVHRMVQVMATTGGQRPACRASTARLASLGAATTTAAARRRRISRSKHKIRRSPGAAGQVAEVAGPARGQSRCVAALHGWAIR